MKPVYINARFLSQRTTGVQRYAAELVRALDALLVATGRSRGGFILLTPPGTTPLSNLQHVESRTVGRLRGQAWEQLELPRYARGGVCLNLCNTAPLLGHSMLVAIHDAGVFAIPDTYSRPFRIWYQFLHPRLGQSAAMIITVSEFSRREIARHAGIPLDKIIVIPNGGEHILGVPPDSDIFARLGLTKRYVLAVSSQSPHKNVGGLLAALEHLQRRDFELVLAGGANPQIFRQTESAQGPATQAGYVSDGELRALYERAECFVYPSLYEGFGLPPLEAMTCGCPVVVSRAASLPEVCGDAAVYCDPRDPRDIATAITKVLEDPALQYDLRRRGKERAAHFTWDRAGRSLLSLIDNLPA